MAAQTFIIDTSCLTTAYRVYYPFDIAPSFWNFMKDRFMEGTFILTNKVLFEIDRGKDDLWDWCHAEIPRHLILDCHSDEAIMSHYGNIMLWGNNHPQYNSLAKQTFSDFENADPFAVAAAMQLNATVVSQEVSAPESVKNIKLPDVCTQFGVGHIDTFKLLRQRGFSM